MPDNDHSFTYQKNKMSAQQSKTSFHSLITIERAQKLDLLIHLISNLSQSLVICGAQGIGKTRLLETLLENNRDNWPICILQGSAGLSFESVLDKFAQQLTKQGPEFRGQDLTAILNHYQKNNSNVVLIIDDAGLLVPGLISALIQYANANYGIRLVLTLTHDELHIKHSSDNIIDECHFIEIPPLSKKQCMTFLQNLSAQPSGSISFNAVTDVLVDNLYSVTHGIPGKILAELPRLSDYESKAKSNLNRVVLVLVGFLVAGAALYLSKPESQRIDRLVDSGVSKKVDTVDISVPVMQAISTDEAIETNTLLHDKPLSTAVNEKTETLFKREDIAQATIEPPIVQRSIAGSNEIQPAAVEKIESKPEVIAATETSEDVKPVVAEREIPELEQNAEVIAVKKPVEIAPLESKKAPEDDAEWVNGQDANYYTMQLMVLSRQQAVINLLKKYPDQQQSIKYFKLDKQGQVKYVLVYGSFASSGEAAQMKKTLPTVFQKAWVRKFKILQKQIAGN